MWHSLKPFVRGSHLVNLTAFSIYTSAQSCSLPVILVVSRDVAFSVRYVLKHLHVVSCRKWRHALQVSKIPACYTFLKWKWSFTRPLLLGSQSSRRGIFSITFRSSVAILLTAWPFLSGCHTASKGATAIMSAFFFHY